LRPEKEKAAEPRARTPRRARRNDRPSICAAGLVAAGRILALAADPSAVCCRGRLARKRTARRPRLKASANLSPCRPPSARFGRVGVAGANRPRRKPMRKLRPERPRRRPATAQKPRILATHLLWRRPRRRRIERPSARRGLGIAVA